MSFAPASKVSISQTTTWIKALAAASKSLEAQDRTFHIFPQKSKERREAMKKLALAAKSLPPGTPIERGIRTPFQTDEIPHPPRPETRERIRELAREALAQDSRQPYVSTTRAGLDEGILATVPGSLTLQIIDDLENDATGSCELVVKNMLWNTGSHGCTITADLLPATFAARLSRPDCDPYRNESRSIVQVEGYIALSNNPFFFESIFSVVPPSAAPNGRSGVILGQRSFMDHLDFRQVPRTILEAHGDTLKDDEWGDIEINEWVDPVTLEITKF